MRTFVLVFVLFPLCSFLITPTSLGLLQVSQNIPSSGVISTVVSTLKFRTDFSDVVSIEYRGLIFRGVSFRNVVNYEEGTARIEVVEDTSAQGGVSFYMEVFKGQPTHKRCDMNWYIRDLGVNQEFYIDSRLKLRADYDLAPPHDFPTWGPWHEIMDLFSEWTSAEPENYLYMPLILGKGPNGFKFSLSLRKGGTDPYTLWSQSALVDVPRGEWFHLRFYIRRDRTNGVVKVWLNGQLMFDVSGVQTMGKSDEFFTTPAKLYGGEILPEKVLWVDSVEVHDGLPSSV